MKNAEQIQNEKEERFWRKKNRQKLDLFYLRAKKIVIEGRIQKLEKELGL